MSPSKGFTLFELLVVMVLIGISCSLVFVSVSSGVLKSRENQFVNEFIATIKRTRSASLLQGKIMAFIINREKREFYMEGEKHHSIPKTIQVEGNNILELEPGMFGIFFFPDGSSSGGAIDLIRENGAKKAITVHRLLGLIKLEETT